MGQAVRSKMAAGKGRKKKNNGSRLSDKLPVMRGAELHNRQANHSTKRKGTPALYKGFFFFFGPRVVQSLAVFFCFFFSGPGVVRSLAVFFFSNAEIMGQTQGKRH